MSLSSMRTFYDIFISQLAVPLDRMLPRFPVINAQAQAVTMTTYKHGKLPVIVSSQEC